MFANIRYHWGSGRPITRQQKAPFIEIAKLKSLPVNWLIFEIGAYLMWQATYPRHTPNNEM
jgi:hypothetical protein